MDLDAAGMGNSDLLQTIAALNWAQTGDPAMFEKVATFRVGYELYQRFSGQREVDALRAQTIAAIAKYVNDNPRAKREDLQKEISKHIFAFAHKVDSL
ncbi:hypothetical protein MAR_001616 [Mya arenaria]|uniref:Uncharacterized protein n=1 Tax=Mya arenaria TaxID=6604 RepID=A0ABY7FGD0_MYAAR|nr:uncharacterized protein LOC128209849 [Mya arenaria]WAR19778.1 hypothetical protein MAR_001616 [Mya arenaria]